MAGGDRYVDKSLGRGGTGGTSPSSLTSPFTAIEATRSLRWLASAEWLEISLLALFLLPLLEDWRPPEAADIDVTLVAVDIEAESRELGVLAYVVEEVEPRLGVKLSLVAGLVFFGVLSSCSAFGCSSLLVATTDVSATSEISALSGGFPPRT